MIDPNNINNLNPQDVNNNVANPIDPNFLPKDSNVYIRTMNTDLTELKSRGGESLPYVEMPSTINNPAPVNMPTEAMKPPAIPETPPMPSINSAVDFSNLNPVDSTVKPINNEPSLTASPNLNDVLKKETPAENHTTLEGIKSKIDALNAAPNATQNQAINNLSSNFNSDINNLITPEEFSPMANVDFNPTPVRNKNKLKIILPILCLLIVLALVWMLIIRPKMLSPKVTFNPTTNTSLLSPATTVTTTKPSPFIMIKNGFQANSLDIDISKSPEIVAQIKAEANNVLLPGEFKVIIPTIKNQFLTSSEIVNAFVDNIPPSLSNNLMEKYLIYGFYGKVHPSLGIILTVNNDRLDQIKADFLSWEKNREIVKSTYDIWLFTTKASTSKAFKEREYLGSTIRYFDYPGSEASFVYAFYQNYIIMTTSNESIDSAINFLQNPDTPIVQ